MKIADFDYKLPSELIAQSPIERRDTSRLLVLNRSEEKNEHRSFGEIVRYLNDGDCLVINDTRVIPARLHGKREDTGAGIEFLLLKRIEEDVWEVILKPGKRAREGNRFVFGDELHAEVIEVLADGNRLVKFEYDGIFEEILERLGEMPLPHYITLPLEDRERYQTVYAKVKGSAAAPTAGLHFTPQLLQKIREKGVKVVPLTLHVGLGTFRPVKAEDIREHHMHTEFFDISEETARAINQTRVEGGRIIAVGTTTVRTLESVYREGAVRSGAGQTDIFIYPPYDFKVIDGLITNFHLPKSTLLMLVSAFAGRERALAAYEEAIHEKYKFFSFGDCMLVI